MPKVSALWADRSRLLSSNTLGINHFNLLNLLSMRALLTKLRPVTEGSLRKQMQAFFPAVIFIYFIPAGVNCFPLCDRLSLVCPVVSV